MKVWNICFKPILINFIEIKKKFYNFGRPQKGYQEIDKEYNTFVNAIF